MKVIVVNVHNFDSPLAKKTFPILHDNVLNNIPNKAHLTYSLANKNLSEYSTGIVYLLAGSNAQSFEPYINKSFNYVIRCRHPAYYARTNTRMPSDIWKQINDILIGQSGYGIKWFEEEKFSNNQ